MRILLIEDEKKVARFISKGLTEESYAVDIAYDGEEGAFLAEINEYDLIILDIMLPKKNGFEVIKQLRGKGLITPVIMLTAKDDLNSKIQGLDLGADDYITKPFAFSELMARIRAIIRRRYEKIDNKLQFGDLIVDPITRRVTRGDKEIDLTNKEYALIEYFVRNPNRVLSRTMISEHVWDYQFDPMTNVIDVYVNYLRQKIDKGFDKKLIHTVRGAGYVLRE
ncbi:MAG TPA: response regulator transcription factor [Candidatus Eremiobacteraeota bacterium]|nr:MAG: Transcriptional activator protein CzcR [bacterium ADurb.Bin363]HPZ09446.1 response regulator transcription factor [Candidatus Eremiobacteraeota bacterium]